MCQTRATIIIPARSYDFLLKQTLENIRKEYPLIKIIVIIDTNEEINLSNVEFIHPDRIFNMSEKRNLGAKISDTEYICFLDSDSYPKQGWLEKGTAFLDNNKDYSAVTGLQSNLPNDTFSQNVVRTVRFSPVFSHKEWCKIIDKSVKEQDVSEFLSSNVIINRLDYLKSGGMDEKLYLTEDNEFSKRFTSQGYKIRFIPQVEVFHRECSPFYYLKKLFCFGYYISNMMISGKDVWFKNYYLKYSLPVILLLGYILMTITSIVFDIDIFKKAVFIIPITVLSLFFFEAVCMSKKLNTPCLKGILSIFGLYVMFCIIWVISFTIGIVGIKIKDISYFYKQY